jgi:hypothetical protein
VGQIQNEMQNVVSITINKCLLYKLGFKMKDIYCKIGYMWFKKQISVKIYLTIIIFQRTHSITTSTRFSSIYDL